MKRDLGDTIGAGCLRRPRSFPVVLAAVVVVLLAACGGTAENPITQVKRAPFPIGSGQSVEKVLSGYPYFRNPVWETYVDEQRRTIVRFAAEYDVTWGAAECPPVGSEVRPAARVFVTLAFFVQGDGAVSLLEADIEAYSATGYSARYLADPGAVARIPEGQPCVACMALFLPASL